VFQKDANGNYNAGTNIAAITPAPLNCTSQVTGNWGTAGTWTNCGGGIPSAGDNATIANTHNVTLNVNSAALGNLTINNGGTLTNTAGNTLTVGGNFSNSGTYSGGSGTVALSGTFTNNNAFTSGAGTWTFGGTAAQSITGTGATTFTNLTLSNAAGLTLSRDVTISTLLTLTSGTFAVGSNTLTLNGSPIGGTAINLSTTASSSLVFGGTTAGVSLPGSVTALNNLTIGNTSGISLGGTSVTTVVGGTLALGANKLTTGSNTLTLSGNCALNSGSGSITRTNGYVIGNLQLSVPATNPATCDYHIGDSNNYAPIRIVKSGTNAGTLTGSTVGTDPGSASLTDPAKNVNRSWTLTAGTLPAATPYTARLQFCTAVSAPLCGVNDVDAGANSANFVATQQVSSVWSLVSSSTASNQTTTGSLSAFGDFSVGERLPLNCTSQAATNWSLASTWTNCRGGIPLSGDSITLNHNVTQNVAATPALNNVTISGSGTLTASGSNAMTIAGNFSNAGTYVGATDTVTLSGTFTNSGTFTKGTSTWVMNGTSTQTLTGTTTFHHLTLNNAAGFILDNSITAAGTLGLQSGIITTGSNILSSSGNCPGAVSFTSGWVNGNLRLTFPSGTAIVCNYYVGSGSVYAPMAISMTSTGGSLTGSTTGNEDPLIATSGIDPNSDANRYWSLWAAGDTLASGNNYSATFTYNTGDLDISITPPPTSFVAGRYNTSWTLIPSTGTVTVSPGVFATSITNSPTGLGPISSTTRYSVGAASPTCDPPSDLTAAYPSVSFTCQCDNFGRATLNPSTIFGGSFATSTTSGSFGLPRIVNNGYLQLTDNSGAVATAATVPGTFPAAGNIISVEFKHYAYNGSGADGIALTLSDATITPTPGAFGGSLGYAQKSNPGSDCTTPGGCPGFAGGWVGMAIDEFGNFSSNSEGRTGGSAPGARPDSVSVRGSGSGQTGYPYMGGSGTLTPGIDAAGATRAPGYNYRIIVDAQNYTWNGSSGTKTTLVSIDRDTTGTGTAYAPLISTFDAYAVNPSQADVPADWKLSFTGSTGGSTNIHELTGLKVCAQAISPPAGYLVQVDNLSPSTCPADDPAGQPIVTVKALRSNGTVATDYTQQVTLSATLGAGGTGGGANGTTWVDYGTEADGTLTTTTNGAANYTFAASDNGVAKFKLTNTNAQSVYITVTEVGGAITTSYATPIVYSGATLSVAPTDTLGTVPVAGRPHKMTITAYSGCGTINTAYDGLKSLDGWYTPASGDHPTGALAPQICTTNGGGTCLPAAGASCQTLSIAAPNLSAGSNLMPALNFVDGVADFCLVTSDVGKYSISLRDDLTYPPLGNVVTGASSTLTVKPFALALFDVKQGATTNPEGTATSGAKFIAAGDNFTATIGGYLWNAGADSDYNGTPNASPSLAQLTASGAAPSFSWPTTLTAGSPYTPAAGVAGTLLPASGITDVCPSNSPHCYTNGVSGVATPLNLTYSEVGSFTLTASTSNFLNTTGTNLSAYMFNSSGVLQSGGLVVGRFHPDHFEVISDSITPACSSGAFTYMGQPFGIDFTVVARNKLNGTTTNYDNNTRGYTLVGTPSLVAEDQLAANQGTDLKAARLSLTGTTNWVLGQYAVTSGVGHNNATFSKPTGAAATWTGTNGAGPYDTLTIGVKATDSDGTLITTPTRDMNATATGVCAGAGCDAKKVGSATQVRLGRLRLLNAYGSELLNVKVPVQAEYYDAGFWKVNTLDACTTIPNLRDDIAIGNYSNAPLGTNMGSAKIPSTSLTLNGGTASFTMTKPTTGVTGSLDIALNLGGGTADTSCVNWSPAVTTTSGASLSWLQFPWCSGKGDPNARVTFGSTKSPFIYLREQY
jgi:MSHA biogenesis protein MshQ